MFEDSLFESTAALRSTASRWPAVVSIAAQGLALGILLAIPLLHPATLLVALPHRLDLLPPPPSRPPVRPPEPPRMHVEPTVSSAPTAPAPPTQPPVLNTATLQPAAPEGPPSVSPINLLGSGSTTSPLPIGLGPATSTTHIGTVSPAAHSIPAGPHAISTGVSAGLLLAPIQPLYPAIARAAHQQGTVTVEALISTTGRIEAAHAIAGPVMLQGAAVDAVRNARYHPFLLNGQPTEVNATFSIHFTLNE